MDCDEGTKRADHAAADVSGKALAGAAQVRLAPAAAAPKLLLAEALERLADASISMTTRHYSVSYANRLRVEAAGGR